MSLVFLGNSARKILNSVRSNPANEGRTAPSVPLKVDRFDSLELFIVSLFATGVPIGKCFFHLLDLIRGIVFLYQKLLEFNPVILVSFFYPNSLRYNAMENTDSVRQTSDKSKQLLLYLEVDSLCYPEPRKKEFLRIKHWEIALKMEAQYCGGNSWDISPGKPDYESQKS
ncbi:hypothetical protein Tco_0913403 [Tanacetum coccineum]